MSGRKRGHVEDAPQMSAAVLDEAFGGATAAVARVWSKTGECAGLAWVEVAEFGQFGPDSPCGDLADALDLLEPLTGLSGRTAGDFPADGCIQCG